MFLLRYKKTINYFSDERGALSGTVIRILYFDIVTIYIALDKRGYHVNIFFLFLRETVCFGYSFTQ